MDKILWKRVENVFHAALDAPLERRADLIRQLSAGDDEVSEEVESLLRLYRDDDTWLSPDAEMKLRDAVETAMRLLADQHPETHKPQTRQPSQVKAHSFSESEVSGWLGADSNRFQDLRPLGHGGMGTVYYAMDRAMQRAVALKFLIPGRRTIRDTSRILSESRALASLRSDHVVTVHEVIEREPHPFLVMEWLRGPSVRRMIDRRGRLPARFAAEIARQVALGLADAHSRQLLHGDIKPANVLLQRKSGAYQPWRAKIIDFGISRPLHTEVASSSVDEWSGTPKYMSPERLLRRGTIDPRSDIYSLGILLFEMLVGDTPYRGTPAMLMRQLESDEPRTPRDADPKLPRDLNSICIKAIAKDPATRYPDANAMASDLQRFLQGKPTIARPLSFVGRFERWVRRNRWLALSLGAAALLATLLFLTACGTAWVFWAKNREIAAERSRAEVTLIEKIPSSHPAFIPEAVNQISEQVGAPIPILKSYWEKYTDDQSRFNIACSLSMLGEPKHDYIVENIGNCRTESSQCQTVLAALHTDTVASLRAIHRVIKTEIPTRTKVKLLMLAHWLGDHELPNQWLTAESIELKTEWVQLFPRWQCDIATLFMHLQNDIPADILESNLLGLGLVDVAMFNPATRQELRVIVKQLRDEQSPPNVQAAAAWLERRYFGDPSRTDSLRMVLITAGTFQMGNDDPSLQYTGRDSHAVQLTRPFLIADREITVEEFQRFRAQSDLDAPELEGLKDWACDPVISPTLNHPVQNVSWYEVIAFCNWMSDQSGLKPAYARSETWSIPMPDGSERVLPAWTLVPDANGFRLPSEAEHEFATRAGTTTSYFFGNDRKVLDHYVAWSNNTRVACAVPGTLMPNGFGLFDTLGNVWEWTDDWYRSFPKEAEIDPKGMSPSSRGFVFRGGGVCTFSGDPVSSSRGTALPDQRFLNVGFRVASNAP